MEDFSTEQILQYQCIIDKTKPGEYELSSLFSSIWESITPTTFGKQFKKNYERGIFSNITHLTIRTDNHNLYKIS